MTKTRRKPIEDIAERLRDILGELKRLIQPQSAPKPVRAPVHVPLRPQRRPRPDPHR